MWFALPESRSGLYAPILLGKLTGTPLETVAMGPGVRVANPKRWIQHAPVDSVSDGLHPHKIAGRRPLRSILQVRTRGTRLASPTTMASILPSFERVVISGFVWLSVLVGCATEDSARSTVIKTDSGTPHLDANLMDPPDTSQAVPDAAVTTCETLYLEAQGAPPEVMIAVDQSTSMLLENRWDAAVEAVSTVSQSLDDNVAFGLAAFGTSSLVCGANRIILAPATGNAKSIVNYLNGTEPLGDTPITAILERIAKLKKYGNAYSSSEYDGLPRLPTSNDDDIIPGSFKGISSVILVTDGAPNCNLDLDPKSCTCTHHDPEVCANNQKYNNPVACLDDTAAIEAVRSLSELGIETHVIGYSSSRWETVLNKLAAAGSEGGKYIPVENALELETSLSEVALGLKSCSFELEEAPPNETYVRVLLNDSDVPHESQVDEGGWALEEKTIRLLGLDCERARSEADVVLEILVECEKVFIR